MTIRIPCHRFELFSSSRRRTAG